MTVWVLLQITFNLLFFAGLVTAWFRLRRPPQDDPRLSRGLQLLQTKITVLEDLSDRTDAQVKQLTALLEHKARTLHDKVLESEQQLSKIEHAMQKSHEVAEIFQDKIPHREIVERQEKVGYVRAAKLAHQGLSVDEITAQVGLPREQVELIAKFNRDRLMFDEDKLPEWANRAVEHDQGATHFQLGEIDFLSHVDDPQPSLAGLSQVNDRFKAAIATVTPPAPSKHDPQGDQMLKDTRVADSIRQSGAVMSLKATAHTLKERLIAHAEDLLKTQSAHVDVAAATEVPLAGPTMMREPDAAAALSSQPTVRKVIFPRLDSRN